MSSEGANELMSALSDVHRYLLDQIPPLNVTEAVETLTRYPPEQLIRTINTFAVEQGRLQGVSMADCLFHALKKVHMISTLKLIDQKQLEGYLNAVVPLALNLCPAEDREALKANLAALRDSLDFGPADVAVSMGGVPKSTEKKPGVLTDLASKTARRFSLVIDRLMKKVASGVPLTPSGASADEAPPPQPVAQLVSMAAENANSEEELNEYVESLKPITGAKETKDLIGILAANVPGWELVAPGVKPSKSIAAMHKVLSLTKDPTKSATRFRELVTAAIDQFNGGSLGACLSILDLADIVITEKKIDEGTVERIRADAMEDLSAEQLKKYSENKSKHAALRKVLGYFPNLRKEKLFADLRGEQKPERRRALLGLLEAYGLEARAVALEELLMELARPANEVDTYYLRNVIYLLHRIPRDPEESPQKELDLLGKASAIGQSIYVIKEAVIPIGNIRNDHAVKVLTTRMAEFEAMLLRTKEQPPYPIEEAHKVLDRIINALAKIGTPAALLTVARHGMRANPPLGDTRARLAVLSQADLSFDEPTVNVIVKAIRENLPSGKLLSRLVGKAAPPPIPLIEALAGTRSELVESLFAQIAENFANEDVGRAARAALDKRADAGKADPATRGGTAKLTGDLQFFGLPALMQSLAEQQATGIVTLSAKHGGHTAGKLLFLKGQFADAQTGHLKGEDALYQLLERPVVGSFMFVTQGADSVKTKGELKDVTSLLFEGIRRHDELKQATLVAADDLMWKAGTVKPTPAPEENDPNVIRETWLKASKGGKIAQFESEIGADAYRVRRLVAHWIEEGALQPVA